ncbi:MAG: hypothetical protein DME98_06230 [Verrucomicrobia bacterium]|nr:MAG: hypothetical protein DME98_06230 [Verrucomicrobiota bacterium]PYJ35979.1 MAG: hypothetical protein DME88_00320 [Verrucomicrobiota bacterium]
MLGEEDRLYAKNMVSEWQMLFPVQATTNPIESPFASVKPPTSARQKHSFGRRPVTRFSKILLGLVDDGRWTPALCHLLSKRKRSGH